MNSSYSKTNFIFTQLYWYIFIWLWYKPLLFRTIDGETLATSHMLLAGTLFSSAVIGYLTQHKSRINKLSIAMNLIIGYGAYTAVSYYIIKEKLITIILGIIAVFIFIYGIALLIIKTPTKVSLKNKLYIRLAVFVRGSQAFLSVGLLIIICFFASQAVMTSGIAQASVKPSNNPDETIANNIKILSHLDDDVWESLSTDEKLDVLQIIANIESRYLGLPNELNVCAANTNPEVLGFYNDNTHTITINVNSLIHTNSWEMVDTVCHEAYHSYQHRLVDIYNVSPNSYKNLRIFKPIAHYYTEFSEYTNVNEDYCTYYAQKCEEDARDYAKNAVYDYYYKIMNYLTSEKS